MSRSAPIVRVEVAPVAVLRRPLWLATGLVGLLGLAVELWHYLGHMVSGDPPGDGWIETFSLSYEGNIPTWYASSLLCSCAVLLFALARAARDARPGPPCWYALAAGFAYMSIDEFVGLHEHLNGGFQLGGLLYFDWIVPAAAVVALLGLLFVPFLRQLPAPVRRRFLLAGAIYVGGAVGMELPLGYWTDRAGDHNLVYALLDFTEEASELAGVTLFLLALWGHWRTLLHATAPAAVRAGQEQPPRAGA
jgi:hypothetical protein